MSPVLFIALVLTPAVALVGLLVWRFKSTQKERKEVLTATSNHKSVKNFHYRPAPSLPTPAASPLTKNDALSQLMPEEDFLQKQQKEIQEEVKRLEAEKAERRELVEVAIQPHARPAAATTSITNAAIDETEAPGRLPPAANTTDSGLNTLNLAIAPATAAAAEDEAVPDAVYDNPLGAAAAAPTKNDTKNRAAEVELRKRQRAARQLQSAGQKNSLAFLLAENK